MSTKRIVKILIVDDEIEIREMLSRHFRFLGYDVETAEDGIDALSKLKADDIDILISDIMMPKMDGIDLLREIRINYPTVNAIMITGYVTLQNAIACKKHGARTLIFKPLEDLSILEQEVKNVVKYIEHWWELLRELKSLKIKGQ